MTRTQQTGAVAVLLALVAAAVVACTRVVELEPGPVPDAALVDASQGVGDSGDALPPDALGLDALVSDALAPDAP